MLTGQQIRQVRELLSLSPSGLAEKVRLVATATIKKVESTDLGPPIANRHFKAIRRTLEALGIDFTPQGPRLRNAGKDETD